jgi:REP element-mobilizing transposase RayT
MGWITWSKENRDKQQGQLKGVEMPRGPRLDAPGTLDHVIVRGIERRKIVDSDKDREDFVTRLGAIALDTGISIYAWALMTNHAHILLRSSTAGLSAFMRRFLSGYAIWYNRKHRRYGHLFQSKNEKVAVAMLQSGRCRPSIPKLRRAITLKLVNENGVSLAETAKRLGISTSGVAQILRRSEDV